MPDRPPDGASLVGARRVLVVDDEEMIRESLVYVLGDQGYEAVGATDGRDALAKLRASPARWSAILLDLTMPLMDGRAFRETQLRDPALARIPVVVLSAYRDVARRVEGLHVAACLAKPPDLSALLEVLGRLESGRR